MKFLFLNLYPSNILAFNFSVFRSLLRYHSQPVKEIWISLKQFIDFRKQAIIVISNMYLSLNQIFYENPFPFPPVSQCPLPLALWHSITTMHKCQQNYCNEVFSNFSLTILFTTIMIVYILVHFCWCLFSGLVIQTF